MTPASVAVWFLLLAMWSIYGTTTYKIVSKSTPAGTIYAIIMGMFLLIPTVACIKFWLTGNF